MRALPVVVADIFTKNLFEVALARRIELAETLMPSLNSSPWMRMHPQRRFS
jgi:hypothetical protein